MPRVPIKNKNNYTVSALRQRKCTVSWARGYSKTIFFTRTESDKKNSQGGKPKVTYITGGKGLLTLIVLTIYRSFQ